MSITQTGITLERPEGFGDIVQQHEWLRTRIMQMDPQLHVVEIKEHAVTRYAKAKDDPEYVLCRVEQVYEVEAVNIHWWEPGMRCKVVRDADGVLRIYDIVPVISLH